MSPFNCSPDFIIPLDDANSDDYLELRLAATKLSQNLILNGFSACICRFSAQNEQQLNLNVNPGQAKILIFAGVSNVDSVIKSFHDKFPGRIILLSMPQSSNSKSFKFAPVADNISNNNGNGQIQLLQTQVQFQVVKCTDVLGILQAAKFIRRLNFERPISLLNANRNNFGTDQPVQAGTNKIGNSKTNPRLKFPTWKVFEFWKAPDVKQWLFEEIAELGSNVKYSKQKIVILRGDKGVGVTAFLAEMCRRSLRNEYDATLAMKASQVRNKALAGPEVKAVPTHVLHSCFITDSSRTALEIFNQMLQKFSQKCVNQSYEISEALGPLLVHMSKNMFHQNFGYVLIDGVENLAKPEQIILLSSILEVARSEQMSGLSVKFLVSTASHIDNSHFNETSRQAVHLIDLSDRVNELHGDFNGYLTSSVHEAGHNLSNDVIEQRVASILSSASGDLASCVLMGSNDNVGQSRSQIIAHDLKELDNHLSDPLKFGVLSACIFHGFAYGSVDKLVKDILRLSAEDCRRTLGLISKLSIFGLDIEDDDCSIHLLSENMRFDGQDSFKDLLDDDSDFRTFLGLQEQTEPDIVQLCYCTLLKMMFQCPSKSSFGINFKFLKLLKISPAMIFNLSNELTTISVGILSFFLDILFLEREIDANNKIKIIEDLDCIADWLDSSSTSGSSQIVSFIHHLMQILDNFSLLDDISLRSLLRRQLRVPKKLAGKNKIVSSWWTSCSEFCASFSGDGDLDNLIQDLSSESNSYCMKEINFAGSLAVKIIKEVADLETLIILFTDGSIQLRDRRSLSLIKHFSFDDEFCYGFEFISLKNMLLLSFYDRVRLISVVSCDVLATFVFANLQGSVNVQGLCFIDSSTSLKFIGYSETILSDEVNRGAVKKQLICLTIDNALSSHNILSSQLFLDVGIAYGVGNHMNGRYALLTQTGQLLVVSENLFYEKSRFLDLAKILPEDQFNQENALMQWADDRSLFVGLKTTPLLKRSMIKSNGSLDKTIVYKIGGNIEGFAYNNLLQRFIVLSSHGLEVWDSIKNMRLREVMTINFHPLSLSLLPNWQLLVARGSNTVQWSLQLLSLDSLPLNSSHSNSNPNVHTNIVTKDEETEVSKMNSTISAVAIDSNQRGYLAVGRDNGSIDVYFIDDGSKLQSSSSPHKREICGLGFSPVTGRFGSSAMVSADVEGIIVQWDMNSNPFRPLCIHYLNDQHGFGLESSLFAAKLPKPFARRAQSLHYTSKGAKIIVFLAAGELPVVLRADNFDPIRLPIGFSVKGLRLYVDYGSVDKTASHDALAKKFQRIIDVPDLKRRIRISMDHAEIVVLPLSPNNNI